MKKINSMKKAQSEAVGFVIIILIVLVIGVIFLGISLRNDNRLVTEDAKISNFLSASFSYTTSCSKDFQGDYQSLDYVIILCSKSGKCLDGTDACEILNQTYSELLPRFDAAGTISAYKLSFLIKQSNNLTEDNSVEFLRISSGDTISCSSKRAGRSYISLYPSNLITQLEVCN